MQVTYSHADEGQIRIAVALGQTLLMASLAEYCGIWPTAGGQQFYVQVLASPKWRPLLSYLVGWALMTAEMSIGSSCAIQNANIIGSFIQTVHPDFVWTVRHRSIILLISGALWD